MKQRIAAMLCVLGAALIVWAGLFGPSADGSPRAAATGSVTPSGGVSASMTNRPPTSSAPSTTPPASTTTSTSNSNSASASSSSRTSDGPSSSAIPTVIANTGTHGHVGTTLGIGAGLLLLGGGFLLIARRPRGAHGH